MSTDDPATYPAAAALPRPDPYQAILDEVLVHRLVVFLQTDGTAMGWADTYQRARAAAHLFCLDYALNRDDDPAAHADPEGAAKDELSRCTCVELRAESPAVLRGLLHSLGVPAERIGPDLAERL